MWRRWDGSINVLRGEVERRGQAPSTGSPKTVPGTQQGARHRFLVHKEGQTPEVVIPQNVNAPGLDGQRGTSLLEVMIAAVIVVILALSFMGSMVGSFVAEAGSQSVNGAVNVARQTMEESLELTFADLLALDGDTALTADGYAVRVSVVQSGVNLALVEVYVCRPAPARTLTQLQALTLTQFKQLPAANGSVYSLVTMKCNVS